MAGHTGAGVALFAGARARRGLIGRLIRVLGATRTGVLTRWRDKDIWKKLPKIMIIGTNGWCVVVNHISPCVL